MKDMIIGHAVKFQSRFFEEEDLSFGPSRREYYVPRINFT